MFQLKGLRANPQHFLKKSWNYHIRHRRGARGSFQRLIGGVVGERLFVSLPVT
jgi:hypothetical protein